jgi:glycosyltransferase involved in cell wall biosynthesis
MKPLLCFVAIVKNEAHCIKRTLDSVKSHVDAWCILDTGSTDGTQAIIQEVMKDLPGSLYEEPFVNFAVSRNRVLELAGDQTVFTLMMSADETLDGGPKLREVLDKQRDAQDNGAYAVEMRDDHSRWAFPRILRANAGWQYRGEVHEVPVAPNGDTTGPRIAGVVVTHAESDPDRKFRRIRDFDIPTLTKVSNDETKSLEERAPSMYFLAQSLEAIIPKCSNEVGGEKISHQMAAMALYWRYAQIAEDPQRSCHDPMKAAYAYFRYFAIASQIDFYTAEELIWRVEPIVEMIPWFPEVRCLLASQAARVDARKGLFLAEEAAKTARAAKEKATHLPTDSSMEWQALRVAASCAKALNNDKRAKELAEKAIEAGAPSKAMEAFIQ